MTLGPVTTHWQTGEQILLRYLRNKPGDLIVPVTVVHDDDEYIALYVAAGTPLKAKPPAMARRSRAPCHLWSVSA